MAEFITGKELGDAVYKIIWEASSTLLILSPYIKLDRYFKELFEKHLNNHKLEIIVVFGKNEGNASRSMAQEDFEFFKQFKKVSIVYVPNLHAKYYGNESAGLITSINLYDYSFKNNIEFGVYSEFKLINFVSPSADQKAWVECQNIADSGEVVFIKRPIYKKGFLGALGPKDYMGSEVLLDNTDSFYGYNKYNRKTANKKISDYDSEIDFASRTVTSMPTREEVERKPSSTINLSAKQNGYCIRTGIEIPFNPSKPFSEQAYRYWAQYSNWDYKENYCHKTGKESYGRTSMRNPIL
jgi:hypothetical protein